MYYILHEPIKIWKSKDTWIHENLVEWLGTFFIKINETAIQLDMGLTIFNDSGGKTKILRSEHRSLSSVKEIKFKNHLHIMGLIYARQTTLSSSSKLSSKAPVLYEINGK